MRSAIYVFNRWHHRNRIFRWIGRPERGEGFPLYEPRAPNYLCVLQMHARHPRFGAQARRHGLMT